MGGRPQRMLKESVLRAFSKGFFKRMIIEITGYVTQVHGAGSFTIKITHDNVKDEKGNHPEVSKEKSILISQDRYPDNDYQRFEKAEEPYQKDLINESVSINKGLRKGDRVECSVFIVDTRRDNREMTYTINDNRNDIETYTKFQLFLNPCDKSFKRLEVDTPQTLKFRKQNYYMDINKTKYEKITGNQYQNKWWMNKNPKITFPILWWIKVRTRVSNFRERFKDPNNLTTSHKMWLIISVIVNIILGILYFFYT